MIPDADIAILGGGCAGLNLAARLGTKKRVLIIEPRTAYNYDHTWCFWKTTPHGFEDIVTHRWNRWRISTPERAVVHDTPDTPYEMIPSSAFYDWARSSIPEDRLMLNTKAGDPRQGSHFLEVPTEKGDITAKYVIDTRPQETTPKLVQEFAGAEIETDAFTYDLETVGLMDFHQGTHFTYTIPLSPSRALIKSTRFSPPGKTDKKRLEKDLQNALPDIPHHTIRKESGQIPLGVTTPSKLAPGSVQAGTRAGVVRPSAGSGFLRINRWAQACTSAILQGNPPVPQPQDTPSTRMMDQMFLNALRQSPEKAPSDFLSLATKVPPEILVRFFSDQPTRKDLINIVRALPTARYLRALLP